MPPRRSRPLARQRHPLSWSGRRNSPPPSRSHPRRFRPASLTSWVRKFRPAVLAATKQSASPWWRSSSSAARRVVPWCFATATNRPCRRRRELQRWPARRTPSARAVRVDKRRRAYRRRSLLSALWGRSERWPPTPTVRVTPLVRMGPPQPRPPRRRRPPPRPPLRRLPRSRQPIRRLPIRLRRHPLRRRRPPPPWRR